MAAETTALTEHSRKKTVQVVPPRAVTPMDLLSIAVNQQADIGKLEKLMDLQLKWEANEAMKAFVKAMNDFKNEPPEIIKNRKAQFDGRNGQVSYDYATLDNVCKQVTAGLSKHGITHRWTIEQSPDLIRVTCILTHEQGHSEETTLCGAADTSGSKNAIQAIGSAVTYLERYSLLAATGLAAKGTDTDGMPQMDSLQFHLESIASAPNMNILETVFKAAYKEATAQRNIQAMKVIIDAKDTRKKEIMEDQRQ